MIENFAVFILTHGRPNNVKTYETLKKQGYTGPVYIIIDNEDEARAEYKKLFGDKVVVFDKKDIAPVTDYGDNSTENKGVIFARNACWSIAESLGVEYFLELDDDYHRFIWKFSSSLKYAERSIIRLDELFELLVAFYKKTPLITLALAQNGDILGGKVSTTTSAVRTKRKAMNVFLCSTSRPFEFVGRVNEDVNTYVALGHRGCIFLTVFNAAIIQAQTQKSSGGMTEIYLDEGTYRKSFYAVMYAPSCTKVYEMGQTHKRLHHKIKWDNAVPCILDPRYKK